MPASATQQDWIDATRRHLLGTRQEERNTLSGAYTAGSGTMSFVNALAGIVPGSRLAIGQSVYYVPSVATSGSTATVIGGQDGSIDTNKPAGSLVWVSPRYTEFEIFEAIKAELADLSAPDNGLFRIATYDLTYESATHGYDFGGLDIIDIYAIYASRGLSGDAWLRVPQINYRLDRSMDPVTFASTNALQFSEPITRNGAAVRVLYRTGFTVIDDPTALKSATGLPDTAHDIVPLGAAMRLVAPREIPRNSTHAQGDTRRAAEVPPGAIANSFRSIAALRAQRIQSEAARLVARYPDRRL